METFWSAVVWSCALDMGSTVWSCIRTAVCSWLELREGNPPHSPPCLTLMHHVKCGKARECLYNTRGSVHKALVIPKEASLWILFHHQSSDAMLIEGWVEMAWLVVPLLACRKIQSIQSLETSGTFQSVRAYQHSRLQLWAYLQSHKISHTLNLHVAAEWILGII
jgi:hypothetical protein